MANIYRGITIPCDAVEGAISIKETVSVQGSKREPTLTNQVRIGERVAIIGDKDGVPLVEKADGTNGTIIGFVHDDPEYDFDPTTDYTKTQAINAGMLRHCGVETNFIDVREVPVKAGESIEPGDYVEDGADGQNFEKASGTTNMIALTTQGSDNIVTIGIQ